MNTPITTNFFRKIELYQEVVALDKIFKDAVNNMPGDGNKNTWEIEKKFLYWTRSGHKHLGSALKAEDFEKSKTENKLKDVRVTENEVRETGTKDQYWLANLVRRGYAEYKNGDDMAGILVNEKGLLLGSVLFDIYKLKKISKQKVWHRWFWYRYEQNYEAQHFLARRYKYLIYWFWSKFGWLAFVGAAVLVIWAFFEKIAGVIWK